MSDDKLVKRALEVARHTHGAPTPARLADRAIAAATADDRLVQRAIDVVRETHGSDVPVGLAARASAAALADRTAGLTKRSAVPWWSLAWPVAWRSAVAVNAVGAVLLAWVMLREPSSSSSSATSGSAVDAILDEETDAVLSGVLGLDRRLP